MEGAAMGDQDSEKMVEQFNEDAEDDAGRDEEAGDRIFVVGFV